MSAGSNIPKVIQDPKMLLRHINFSKKLHKEVQNMEKEVNWAEIFNDETSYDVISLVANQFVQDVNKLIYNLHEIMIKVNKNQSSYNDLKVLVNKLSRTSSNLQEAFGQEFLVLKSKLISEMKNVVKEAQSLTSIVQKDELHEYKSELVDSLSEILSDLQKVVIYNQLKKLTQEELEQLLNEHEERNSKVVADNHAKHETSVDEAVVEAMVKHVLHGVASGQPIIYHLHNVANNYNDPIKGKINQAAKNLNQVSMDVTAGMYKTNRAGEGTSHLEKSIVEAFPVIREIMNLTSLINQCDQSGKDSENLKNLVLFGLSNILTIVRRFARDDPKILLKHVNFAKKLHKEVQNIEKEVNWAEIFNDETSYDVVSSVANQFVQDVNKLIYNLHQIMIKINKNQSSYNDLKVLVNKLSKTSSNLQEAYGQEFLVLKSKLISEMKNVVKEAQSLTSIVQKDELHEYKSELVDSLSEILSDLQKVVIYNQLKKLTQKELEQLLNEHEERNSKVIADNHAKHETSVDEAVVEGMVKHALHGVGSAQPIIYHLHNVANNYNDPIKGKINQAAKNLNQVGMDVIAGMYKTNRAGEGTSHLEKSVLEGFQVLREIMNLTSLINQCDQSGKDSENLKNLVLFGLSNILSIVRRFARDMSMELLEKM